MTNKGVLHFEARSTHNQLDGICWNKYGWIIIKNNRWCDLFISSWRTLKKGTIFLRPHTDSPPFKTLILQTLQHFRGSWLLLSLQYSKDKSPRQVLIASSGNTGKLCERVSVPSVISFHRRELSQRSVTTARGDSSVSVVLKVVRFRSVRAHGLFTIRL